MINTFLKSIISTLVSALLLCSCNGVGTADFGEVAGSAAGNNGSTSSSSFTGLESIDSITDNTAVLNWTHNAAFTLYHVFDVSGASPVLITAISAPTDTYNLSSLTLGTTYTYRVRGVDSNGSVDSNTVDISFTTSNGPDAPSSLALLSPSTSPGFDNTPTITVAGVKSGDTTRLFTDSNCSTQVGVAVSSGLTVSVTTSILVPGSYTFYANTTSTIASACSVANVSYTVSACPNGYVSVPGNITLGVNNFCVMEFEAKNDGAGNPVSKAEDSPWISINQTTAKSECNSLGANYDLISNPEWMALARDIETVDANWTGGTVGSGCLFRGNTGGTNACSGADSAYDGPNPDFGTSRSDNGTASLTLSNGAQVWDIVGNVWEWVDWSLGGGLTSGPTTCVNSWLELPVVSCGALAANDYTALNPSGEVPASYNSNFGLGTVRGGAGGAALRGGSWSLGLNAGIYNLFLSLAPTITDVSVGFRCVYRP